MSEPTTTIVDAFERDVIAGELDRTLFVEAGAGTGKTSALISRIVALVSSGRAKLDEIAAITFTEAAAGELRSRLAKALADADVPIVGAERTSVEDATITTIHGFAQRLLAEFPIEAGLPLRFEVLDEVAGAVEFERGFTRFLDELFDDPDLATTVLASVALGVGTDALRSLAQALDDDGDLESATVAGGADEPLEVMVPRLVGSLVELGRVATGFASGCLDESDRLLTKLDQLSEDLVALGACEDWLDQLRCLDRLRPQKAATTGRKGSWPDIAEVRDALARFEAARTGALESISASVAGSLGVRLLDAARHAAEERRERGLLRFHDLLVLARNLLRDHRAVRRQVRARYRYLLVDEFQDTDPLQLEMVLLIGGDGTEEVDPGRLFFVGDPKQSIYSFRGADLALYEQTRERLVGDRPTRLRTNFRSTPSVIEFVNELFARVFSPDGEPDGEHRSADLVSARADVAACSVTLLGGPDPSATARSRRSADATEIAAVIARAVEEAWPVSVGGLSRPLRLGDVAILLPTRTGLGLLEAALDDAGIDYRVAHATAIYASSEVEELRALLAVLEHPSDARRVLAALRSAVMGVSDVELRAWHNAGGAWRLDSRVPLGGPARVADALATLQRYLDKSLHLNVAETLELLVEEREVRQLLAGRRNRVESLRRVEFLLERARAFVEAGEASIGEFLRLCEREARLGVRGVELLAADETTEAVRIMTVHGAKGLEFPFVVLADLDGRGGAGPSRGASVLRGPTGELELRLRAERETPGHAAARDAARRLERAEQLRLAYVGATRARDHLVLALGHRPVASGEPSLAAQIVAASAELEGRFQRLDAREGRPEPIRASVPVPESSTAVQGAIEAFRSGRSELLATLGRSGRIAPSSLETAYVARRVAVVDRTEEPTGEPEDAWRRARQASAIGRAVHLALQRVDLSSTSDLEEHARGAALEERVAEEASRVAFLARRAFESPAIAAAIAAPRHWRELAFSAAVGEALVEGVIDLCFEEAGGFVVVDYKTDAVPDDRALERARDRYRLQIGAYVLGLQAATGGVVRRAVLVFLAAPGAPREVVIDDPGAAAAEAALAIAERGRP